LTKFIYYTINGTAILIAHDLPTFLIQKGTVMKYTSVLFACAVVASTVISPPAMANSAATADAAASGTASASAGGVGARYYGSTSVGAAYCTDGVALGPIGVTKTLRPCVAAQISKDGLDRGTITKGEDRAVRLQALDDLGYGITYSQQSGSAKKSSAVSAPKPIKIMLAGTPVQLTPEQTLAYQECSVQRIKGTRVRKPGC